MKFENRIGLFEGGFSIYYIIESIIHLTADLYYEQSKEMAREVYLHGVCFEFAKIVKEFVPDIVVYINKEKDHCVFSFEGVFYDANGMINVKMEDYNVASLEEIAYMEKSFGFLIKGLRLYENITFEIRKRTLEKIIQKYRQDISKTTMQRRH